ncbi:MAG: peptide-methionine (S)-S-oxide reductase MsrA [Alkalispirochaeta sp.]
MRTHVRLLTALAVCVALSAPVFAQQPAFDFSSLEDDEAAAVLAGGCFWCMEPPYDELPGVVETISGYTGGTVENPTYRQVVRNDTGHYEAVIVVYRPEEISYEELLDVFWVNIDPLDAGGQFCDRGSSYRSGIFYRTSEQRRAAEASKAELEESGRLRGTVVTEVMAAEEFYVAEEYHQDYYLKNPIRYRTYRTGCGRDARLRQLWGAAASR